MPQLTIAIPTYNRLGLLKRALASALAELKRNPGQVEVLVLDNASIDATWTWLRSQPKVQGLRLLRQRRNVGMVGNWNVALKHAKGRLLTLLHDDDVLLPGFVQTAFEAHARFPDIGFSFGAFDVLKGEGPRPVLRSRPLGKHQRLLSPALAWSWIFHQFCPVTAVTVVFDRRRLVALGGFRPMAALAADGDAYLRLAAQSPVLYRAGTHAAFGMHDNNLQKTMVDGSTVRALQALALKNAPPKTAWGGGPRLQRRLAAWLGSHQEALIGLHSLTSGGAVSNDSLLRSRALLRERAPRSQRELALLLALPRPLASLLWRVRQALSHRWGFFVPSPEECHRRLGLFLGGEA